MSEPGGASRFEYESIAAVTARTRRHVSGLHDGHQRQLVLPDNVLPECWRRLSIGFRSDFIAGHERRRHGAVVEPHARVGRLSRRHAIACEPVQRAEQRISVQAGNNLLRAANDVPDAEPHEGSENINHDRKRAQETSERLGDGPHGVRDHRRRVRRRRANVRLLLSSKGDGVADAVRGLVTKGDIEGVGLVRPRTDERRESAGARVAFTAAPDRVHIGRDRHQLGKVVLQFAVIVGRIEQAFAIGSAIWIGEDGEAREMDPPAAREVDAWSSDPVVQPLPADVVPDGAQNGAERFLLALANRREYCQRSRHPSPRPISITSRSLAIPFRLAAVGVESV